MYNLLISAALALATFVVVASIYTVVAAVLPALLVWAIALFVLTRRIGRAVDGEMQKLVPMLQSQQVDAARAHLQEIKRKYARWQVLLEGQIDAQLGMLDYLQMKWDEALPKLEKGRFRNWQAQVCIGAIHYRRGDKDKAWAELAAATNTAPKESIVYVVYANLLLRSGDRTKALAVLDQGLKSLPDSELLQRLHKDVANKRKIKTESFPDTWYQFFPEDLLKSHLVRGRKGPQAMQAQQPRFGARMAPRR